MASFVSSLFDFNKASHRAVFARFWRATRSLVLVWDPNGVYACDGPVQATLSGAIDVIAVRQNDGSIVSTPFHVRFGKFKVRKPQESAVFTKFVVLATRLGPVRCAVVHPSEAWGTCVKFCAQVMRPKEKRVFLSVNDVRIDLEMRVSG